MNKLIAISLIVFVLLAITLPFIIAINEGGYNFYFSGFLFNPIDGNAYLAKMYQGWSGSWRFTLPYTSEPGNGAYINLFYIFLGHLSRWSGIPIAIMFHLIRLLASIALLKLLVKFNLHYMRFDRDFAFKSFFLMATGSGIGWLLLPFGTFTSDLWVAEAYPFLSCYTNPHFPFCLALMLWVFMLFDERYCIKNSFQIFLIGLLLSIISPFGLVIVAIVMITKTLLEYYEKKEILWENICWLLAGGGPLLIYTYWVTKNDPILAGWSVQNVTQSPPIWDLIISLSPTLILAFIGVKNFINQTKNKPDKFLLIWFCLGLLIIYFPFELQRRFMLGIYIPTVSLAAFGLSKIEELYSKWKKLLWLALILLSFPTNIIIILSGIHGIKSHDASLYLTREEAHAMVWIKQSTPLEAVILASPEIGMFIPAHTGRRVIYGHPFETINAEVEKEWVIEFYKADWSEKEAEEFISERNIDYIFFGPREQAIGFPPYINNYQKVYKENNVCILGVNKRK